MSDINAADILALIHKKYDGKEYIVLEEVPNATGFEVGRWIDAAVFCLWPSKGLTRSAFEIKVSRSDFIRELQNPAKHRWALESFHEFWFVGPKDIFQDGEIPERAGWMYPRGDRLCIKKHCARNETPKLTDTLLAAFMRAANNAVQSAKKVNKEQILRESKEHQVSCNFEKAVYQFCEKRGMPLYFHNPASIDDVKQQLEKASMDKEVALEKEQLQGAADRFQRDIIELFKLFALIAHKGLLARDEMGQFLIGRFGDKGSDFLRGDYKFAHDKRYAELIDTILNWNKLEW